MIFPSVSIFSEAVFGLIVLLIFPPIDNSVFLGIIEDL